MAENKNLIQMQKSFVLPRLGKLQALEAWPNATVPSFAQVNELIPELCKVPYDYLYRDSGRAMAECSLLVWEYTGLSLLGANLDCYNFEAESTGAKLNFYTNHIPDVDRNDFLIKDESDLEKIKFGGLNSGRIPYLIEYSKAYTELCGVEQFPSFCAPWSLACNLYGYENLIMATMEDPEFVHEMMRRIAEDLSGPMLKALNEVIPGLNTFATVDAWSSPPMVTMDIIDEFSVPYLKKILQVAGIDVPISDGGVWGISKLEGKDRERFVQFLVDNGTLTTFDPDVEILTPEYLRKLADENQTAMWLGMSTSLLESGTVDQIVARVKHYVLAGKNGITPLTFFFNNIAPHTPVENIKAAVAAVEIYGAPGADENTPFVMPEVESFEEFLKRKIANNSEGYSFEWLKKSKYSYLI